MGVIGLAVAAVGLAFAVAQKGFWLLFGVAYLVLGALYVAGKADILMRRIGLHRPGDTSWKSSLGLGFALGVNVPACAAPLLFAVAGLAAGSQTYAVGFFTMGLFGIALSVMAFVPTIARAIESLGTLSRRLHIVLGALFIAVGLWSVWFGLFVNPADWQLQP